MDVVDDFRDANLPALMWAADMVEPMIKRLLNDSTYEGANNTGGYLIIGYLSVGVNSSGIYEKILKRTFGDPDSWKYPFDEIADNKARLTAATGLSSREALTLRPDLVPHGSSRWWGSILTGLVVFSFSGFEMPVDDAVCQTASGLYICAKAEELKRADIAAEEQGSMTFVS